MTITASVVADSLSIESGHRLTTLQLRYQRFIHAEFMTHRDFSRNASSSRAIPVTRLIQDVIDDTAMPIHWGKNQPGMQAHEEHDGLIWAGGGASYTPEKAWRQARDNAINVARAFSDAGYHKQIVNRLLEPFSHINVVVTATDWDNFFELRLHPDAQPEIRQLAVAMRAALDGSSPVEMQPGQWHLPYVTTEDRIGRTVMEQIQMSAARCARVSYKTHDGEPTDPDKDIALAVRLWESQHLSPFEHPAQLLDGRHANFSGWRQARHYAE